MSRPLIAAGLLEPLDAAEALNSGQARFLRRQPLLDVLLRLELDVEPELLIKLALDGPLYETTFGIAGTGTWLSPYAG